MKISKKVARVQVEFDDEEPQYIRLRKVTKSVYEGIKSENAINRMRENPDDLDYQLQFLKKFMVSDESHELLERIYKEASIDELTSLASEIMIAANLIDSRTDEEKKIQEGNGRGELSFPAATSESPSS